MITIVEGHAIFASGLEWPRLATEMHSLNSTGMGQKRQGGEIRLQKCLESRAKVTLGLLGLVG